MVPRKLYTKEQRDLAFSDILNIYQHIKDEDIDDTLTFLEQEEAKSIRLQEFELADMINGLYGQFVLELQADADKVVEDATLLKLLE